MAAADPVPATVSASAPGSVAWTAWSVVAVPAFVREAAPEPVVLACGRPAAEPGVAAVVESGVAEVESVGTDGGVCSFPVGAVSGGCAPGVAATR